MGIHETYQTKVNRDRRAVELAKIYGKGRVWKYSLSGQVMHPMYILDYDQPLSAEDKGFGNTLYRTYFSKIYIVEIRNLQGE